MMNDMEMTEIVWHLKRLFTVRETTCTVLQADYIIEDAAQYSWYMVKYLLNGSESKYAKLVLLDDPNPPPVMVNSKRE